MIALSYGFVNRENKKFSQKKKSPFYGNVEPQSLLRRAVLLVYSDEEKPFYAPVQNLRFGDKQSAKKEMRYTASLF